MRCQGPTDDLQVVQKALWSPTGLRSLSNFLITALMAVAAPFLAMLIHSAWVFHRGYAMYNADIGGFEVWERPHVSMASSLLSAVAGSAAAGVPTLLLLIAFRRKRLVDWAVWTLCVCAWTYFLWAKEIIK